MKTKKAERILPFFVYHYCTRLDHLLRPRVKEKKFIGPQSPCHRMTSFTFPRLTPAINQSPARLFENNDFEIGNVIRTKLDTNGRPKSGE
jgi:hypothetical protein